MGGQHCVPHGPRNERANETKTKTKTNKLEKQEAQLSQTGHANRDVQNRFFYFGSVSVRFLKNIGFGLE